MRSLGKQSFDHVRVGDGDSRTYECFDPPWWQVWRWVAWLWRTRVRKIEHGSVTFHVNGGMSTAGARRMIEKRVRTFYPAPPVRRRIEYQFRPKG